MILSQGNCTKIIILGVGNSGTRLLGRLVFDMLGSRGCSKYHYEPLYWSGADGEKDIRLNKDAIREHCTFPLQPGPEITNWSWMETFIDDLDGLAKFIRAGSRIRLFIDKKVKVIWITRELYSYLASMQKNFPRCAGVAGWHHRPGEYDDIDRLKEIYPRAPLSPDEDERVVAEAAWWHLHNGEIQKFLDKENMHHIRYEDLCENPLVTLNGLADFLDLPPADKKLVSGIEPPPERAVTLLPRHFHLIEEIAGPLNKSIYPCG